jgi:hypothetical protein
MIVRAALTCIDNNHNIARPQVHYDKVIPVIVPKSVFVDKDIVWIIADFPQ